MALAKFQLRFAVATKALLRGFLAARNSRNKLVLFLATAKRNEKMRSM